MTDDTPIPREALVHEAGHAVALYDYTLAAQNCDQRPGGGRVYYPLRVVTIGPPLPGEEVASGGCEWHAGFEPYAERLSLARDEGVW